MSRAMKDSDVEHVGLIPVDWNICRLKNLAIICNGQDYKNVYEIDGDYPVIGSGGVFSSSNKYLYEKESVLLGRKGTIDKPIYVDFPFWTVDTMFYTRIQNNCHAKYFYYLCTTIPFDYYQFGTALPSMTQQNLNDIRFPDPPKKIQKKIALYLDKANTKIDRLIALQEEMITELQAYKQSVITEAITKGLDPDVMMKDSGVEWIGEAPHNWDIVQLKNKFMINKRIAGRLGFDVLSVTQNGIKIKDISSNEGQISQDYSKYQLVYPDDFVMNHMDLLTGFVDLSVYSGVTSPDYRVFTARSHDICLRYYLYVFQTCYRNKLFYGLGQGVAGFGRWRLPARQFLYFFLPVPPIIVQERIVSFLDKKCANIDQLICVKQTKVIELKEYKKSLIYECVTGKRDCGTKGEEKDAGYTGKAV